MVAPYGKWQYYDPKIKQIEQIQNYAENKTKMVSWFVSNCYSNNNRLDYAKELQNYVEVNYVNCILWDFSQ